MARFCIIPNATHISACLAAMWLLMSPGVALPGNSVTSGTGTEPGIEAFLKGSYVEAARALDQRARARHGPSQYYLGLLHLRGYAGRTDRALAYAWFAAGEANGHAPSRVMRRKLHPRLSIGDLPRAQRLARQYVYQFSGEKIAPSPCFRSAANDLVVPCQSRSL